MAISRTTELNFSREFKVDETMKLIGLSVWSIIAAAAWTGPQMVFMPETAPPAASRSASTFEIMFGVVSGSGTMVRRGKSWLFACWGVSYQQQLGPAQCNYWCHYLVSVGRTWRIVGNLFWTEDIEPLESEFLRPVRFWLRLRRRRALQGFKYPSCSDIQLWAVLAKEGLIHHTSPLSNHSCTHVTPNELLTSQTVYSIHAVRQSIFTLARRKSVFWPLTQIRGLSRM